MGGRKIYKDRQISVPAFAVVTLNQLALGCESPPIAAIPVRIWPRFFELQRQRPAGKIICLPDLGLILATLWQPNRRIRVGWSTVKNISPQIATFAP